MVTHTRMKGENTMEHTSGRPEQNKRTELGPAARVFFFAAAAALAIFSAYSKMSLSGIAASLVGAALILIPALASGSGFDTAAAFLPGIASYLIFAVTWGRSEGLWEAFVSALPALFMTVLAFGIWSTVKLGMNRAASISFTALLCVVFWLLCAAVRIRAYTGKLDLDTIRAVLDAFFDPFRKVLASITFDNDGSNLQLYSDTDIENMISTAKRTFIGSLGALMLVAAYLVTVAARVVSAVCGVFSVFPTEERDEIAIMPNDDGDSVGIFVEHIRLPWRIEISTISAVVAVAAYVVCILFQTPEKQLAAVTVAENMLILLMPGLVYVGVRSLVYGLSGNSRGLFGLRPGKKNAFGPIAVAVAAVALFFVSPAAPLILLALNGVIDIFSENFRRASASHIVDDAGDRKE